MAAAGTAAEAPVHRVSSPSSWVSDDDDATHNLSDTIGFTASGLGDTLLLTRSDFSDLSSGPGILNMPAGLDAALPVGEHWQPRPGQKKRMDKVRSANQRAFFAHLRSSNDDDEERKGTGSGGAQPDVGGGATPLHASPLTNGASGMTLGVTSGSAGTGGSSPSQAMRRVASQRSEWSAGSTMHLTGAWELNDTLRLKHEPQTRMAGRQRNLFMAALGGEPGASHDEGHPLAASGLAAAQAHEQRRQKQRDKASRPAGLRVVTQEQRDKAAADVFDNDMPAFLTTPTSLADTMLTHNTERSARLEEFDRLVGTGGLDDAVISSGLSFSSAQMTQSSINSRLRSTNGSLHESHLAPRRTSDASASQASTTNGDLVLRNAFFTINKDDAHLPKHNIRRKMVGERSKELKMFLGNMGDTTHTSHSSSSDPHSGNSQGSQGSALRTSALRAEAHGAALLARSSRAPKPKHLQPLRRRSSPSDRRHGGKAKLSQEGAPTDGGDGVAGAVAGAVANAGVSPRRRGRRAGEIVAETEDVAAVVLGDFAAWEAARAKARQKREEAEAARLAEQKQRTKKKRRKRKPQVVVLREVVAVAPYTADDVTELSFVEGDVIEVLTEDDQGWWEGRMGGVQGWFPCTFVADLEPEGKPSDRSAAATHTTAQEGSSNAGSEPASAQNRSRAHSRLTEGAGSDATGANGSPGGNGGAAEPIASPPSALALGGSPVRVGGAGFVEPVGGAAPPMLDTALPAVEAQLLEAPIILVALSGYTAQDPNELSFAATERLVLLTDDGSGWMKGRIQGTKNEGWFPAALVQDLGEDEDFEDVDGVVKTPAHVKSQLKKLRDVSRTDAANFFREHGHVVAAVTDTQGIGQLQMAGSARKLNQDGLGSPRRRAKQPQSPHLRTINFVKRHARKLSGAFGRLRQSVSRSLRSRTPRKYTATATATVHPTSQPSPMRPAGAGRWVSPDNPLDRPSTAPPATQHASPPPLRSPPQQLVPGPTPAGSAGRSATVAPQPRAQRGRGPLAIDTGAAAASVVGVAPGVSPIVARGSERRGKKTPGRKGRRPKPVLDRRFLNSFHDDPTEEQAAAVKSTAQDDAQGDAQGDSVAPLRRGQAGGLSGQSLLVGQSFAASTGSRRTLLPNLQPNLQNPAAAGSSRLRDVPTVDLAATVATPSNILMNRRSHAQGNLPLPDGTAKFLVSQLPTPELQRSSTAGSDA